MSLYAAGALVSGAVHVGVGRHLPPLVANSNLMCGVALSAIALHSKSKEMLQEHFDFSGRIFCHLVMTGALFYGASAYLAVPVIYLVASAILYTVAVTVQGALDLYTRSLSLLIEKVTKPLFNFLRIYLPSKSVVLIQYVVEKGALFLLSSQALPVAITAVVIYQLGIGAGIWS